MASSVPARPLLLLLLLLLVLLAGAARAALHFRPGQSCYRPLRGDQLSNLGRRSVPAWGAGLSLGLPVHPRLLGTLPPPWGALPPLTFEGQIQFWRSLFPFTSWGALVFEGLDTCEAGSRGWSAHSPSLSFGGWEGALGSPVSAQKPPH